MSRGWGDRGVGGNLALFFFWGPLLFFSGVDLFTKCRDVKENLTLFSGGIAARSASQSAWRMLSPRSSS